ncbi:hypothetical protein LBW94_043830 [Nocardia sp. alder85J]|nr:hypothetical protein [Nocardia sp. alder85J]
MSEVGNRGGFGHPNVLAPLLGGLALTAAFTVRSLRARHPLVDLRLSRQRSFAMSALLLFASGLDLFGSMLLLPLYYQQIRHDSVVVAGIMSIPQAIGTLPARLAGVLVDRLGPRPVVLAGVVAALGTVPFALDDGHTPIALPAVALVVRGAGLSTLNLAVLAGAFLGIAPVDVPHASSITRVAQQLGGAFGAAVLAVILQRQFATHPAAHPMAFAHTFWWALAFSAVAFVPALLLPRHKPAQA